MARRTYRGGKQRLRAVKSTVGDIIDARFSKDIHPLCKKIAEGPITIILVYADWCGHCHTYKPTFDKDTANSSVPVAKIREDMLPELNRVLNEQHPGRDDIEVTGYPTVVTVDPEGNSGELSKESVSYMSQNAASIARQEKQAPQAYQAPQVSQVPQALKPIRQFMPNALEAISPNKTNKNINPDVEGGLYGKLVRAVGGEVPVMPTSFSQPIAQPIAHKRGKRPPKGLPVPPKGLPVPPKGLPVPPKGFGNGMQSLKKKKGIRQKSLRQKSLRYKKPNY